MTEISSSDSIQKLVDELFAVVLKYDLSPTLSTFATAWVHANVEISTATDVSPLDASQATVQGRSAGNKAFALHLKRIQEKKAEEESMKDESGDLSGTEPGGISGVDTSQEIATNV